MPSIPSRKFLRQLFLFVVFAAMLAFGGDAYAQGPGQSSNLLTQVETIPLEGVEGRIDHLGLDAKGKRLFVAAFGNDTVEVVDLDSARDRPRMPHLTRRIDQLISEAGLEIARLDRYVIGGLEQMVRVVIPGPFLQIRLTHALRLREAG